MLAAVLQDFNRLVLEDVPIPEPGLGEVVVRIRSCGICATDYKAIVGIRRNVTFPSILGHEPSGIVARVGPGVVHFKEGDEVICQPSGYCDYCKHCRTGNTHYWEWGTQATQTARVGDQDCAPYPRNLNGVSRSTYPRVGHTYRFWRSGRWLRTAVSFALVAIWLQR
jgi:D-arabinose 1-dehydrogenase-like Zn-dependent alcohol dehydrogenase